MSKRVQKVFNLPSRTKQGFRDECDINIIMKRFKNTMGVDYLNRYQGYLSGEFGDFSMVSDYRSAIERIDQARGVFEALPAKVRSRFRNGPAEFLDFVQNPANLNEMIDMGLATKRAPEKDAPDSPRSKDVTA